jgi:hypothetical protein
MEAKPQTVTEMYERLQSMIRQRHDTGFRLAVTDALLEPSNPFGPTQKRKPQATVAIAALLVGVLALIFVYFSFGR